MLVDSEATAALEDLCRVPGLFAGMYRDLHLLSDKYVERRYQGVAGVLGMAKAYPTTEALLEFMQGA